MTGFTIGSLCSVTELSCVRAAGSRTVLLFTWAIILLCSLVASF
jgi:hypothetical protein